jgi:hypothetical protein
VRLALKTINQASQAGEAFCAVVALRKVDPILATLIAAFSRAHFRGDYRWEKLTDDLSCQSFPDGRANPAWRSITALETGDTYWWKVLVEFSCRHNGKSLQSCCHQLVAASRMAFLRSQRIPGRVMIQDGIVAELLTQRPHTALDLARKQIGAVRDIQEQPKEMVFLAIRAAASAQAWSLVRHWLDLVPTHYQDVNWDLWNLASAVQGKNTLSIREAAKRLLEKDPTNGRARLHLALTDPSSAVDNLLALLQNPDVGFQRLAQYHLARLSPAPTNCRN